MPMDDKLKAAGYDPEQAWSQINKHVQGSFGGNLQSYVDAIKSKPPDKLSDPQAAAALQALSPALFGQGIGADPQRPGVMSFNFGQTAPVPQGAMNPRAAAMLNAIGQHQQANPFTIPVAPGTKARWQVQDEEAKRAQAALEALTGEKWDYQKERDALADLRYDQERADTQAYRSAQLAASRVGSGGGAAMPGVYEDRTATITERDRIPLSDAGRRMIEDIRSNPDISLGQWKAVVQGDSEIRSELMRQGIDVNDFLSFIDEQYTLYHLMEAQSRVGKDAMPWEYGQDLQKRQDLISKYNPWGAPKAPAEKLTAEQEATWWWKDLGPQGQQQVKNQLVKYGQNEINESNIEMLSPAQLLDQWNKMLGGR